MKRYSLYVGVSYGLLHWYRDLAHAEEAYERYCKEYPDSYIVLTEWKDNNNIWRRIRQHDGVKA